MTGARPRRAMTLPVGARLGPYEIRSLIGIGGMGAVYTALDTRLHHPHICTLFDVGEQDGTAFFVMEYLEGETLDDRLSRGPLPANDVLTFASQIADALDHAHCERFVHR